MSDVLVGLIKHWRRNKMKNYTVDRGHLTESLSKSCEAPVWEVTVCLKSEVDKEIERLEKEKEEFRKDNCKVNEERAHVQGRNMVLKEEIKRVREEKEWLIDKYGIELYENCAVFRKKYNENSIKQRIVLEMKQTLKEK